MKTILTDGGMGQELLRRSQSPPTPLWSGRVLMDEPAARARPARRFIEAGARVITINSYAATPERLAREGAVRCSSRCSSARSISRTPRATRAEG